MGFVKSLAALALAATSLVNAHGHQCRPRLDPKELAARLSPEAAIYLPTDEEFAHATARWSIFRVPSIKIAVAPATEKDVAEIVSDSRIRHRPRQS